MWKKGVFLGDVSISHQSPPPTKLCKTHEWVLVRFRYDVVIGLKLNLNGVVVLVHRPCKKTETSGFELLPDWNHPLKEDAVSNSTLKGPDPQDSRFKSDRRGPSFKLSTRQVFSGIRRGYRNLLGPYQTSMMSVHLYRLVWIISPMKTWLKEPQFSRFDALRFPRPLYLIYTDRDGYTDLRGWDSLGYDLP